jgi:two-component system, OmpR family, sensor kinase
MLGAMSTDKLNRQELSWLLAQEARAAADLLRKGVSDLSLEQPNPLPYLGEVTSTLDALDDAMRTLASLNTGGGTSSTRRGRIDLATLLLEMAPSARVGIEPGKGTEVFGDEGELRRMMQVLLSFGMTTSQSADSASSAVSIRREDETVRITVALGPDSSATGETEQAWLHRMALRYGGVLSLGGGQVTLELPADIAEERRELEELRRDLAAAQEQAEIYARELASMFQRRTLPPGSATRPPPRANDDRFGSAMRLALALDRRGELGRELVRSLAPLARPASHEPPTSFELGPWLAGAAESLARRADERRVRLETVAGTAGGSARRQAALALITLLGDQAIEATPAGGRVELGARAEGEGLLVWAIDGGPAVPFAQRDALLRLESDGVPLGRPADLELFFADALARHLGGFVELGHHGENKGRSQAFLPLILPRD